MAMTLEQGLIRFLLTDPAVFDLIGERLSPWSGQGEVLPRVVYDLVSTDTEASLTGSSDQPVTTIRLSCFGNTRDEARAVAKALRNSDGAAGGLRLKEFQGDLGGVWVQSTQLQNEQDAEVSSQQADGRPVPGISFDLVIGYIEQS